MTVRSARRLSLFSFALLLSVVFGLTSAASAQEVRTWSDISGRLRVQGKLVNVTGGYITLEQINGQRMEIAITRLSRADQDYIKAQRNNPQGGNASASKSGTPSPPQTPAPDTARATPGSGIVVPATGSATPATGNAMPANRGTAPVTGNATPATGNAPATSGTAPATGSTTPPAADFNAVVDDSGAFESRLVTPSLQSLKTIPLTDTGVGWNVDVPLLLGSPPENHSGKPIAMPPMLDFFERQTGFVINATGTRATVSYKLERGRDAQTRVVIADLKSKKTLANRATAGSMAVAALSDDAGTVVMRSDGPGWGGKDRLELWNVSEKAILKGPAWIPFDDAKGSDRDVQSAAFTADGRLLTSSESGRVIVWSLDPVRPQWSCQGRGRCPPALSPGRRHLLLATDKQLCLIDLTTSALIASQPLEWTSHPHLSFSPQATRFAVMGIGEGKVCDTATGQTYREITTALLPKFTRNERVIFVNDDQAIFGETCLLDLPSLVAVWDYSGATAVTDLAGIIWYLKQDGDQRPGVMFGAPLPHKEATEALQTAMNDPDYFVLKPGKSVKLNLDALPDAAKREEVRKSLTAKLAEQQITVSPSAAVEVVCRFDPPKNEEIAYRDSGFIGIQTVNFPMTVAHITYTAEGKEIWRNSGNNLPVSIKRRGDQSLQDAAKEYEIPPYDFFKRTDLPKMLVSPSRGEGRTLGRLIVTTTGLRPDPRPLPDFLNR